MNIYDLLNLGKTDKKQKIEEAIKETREELQDLTQERMCRVYCEQLRQSLGKRHVLNRIMDTGDLGYDFSHQFALVPEKEDSFFLLDCTYSQFESKDFPDLLEKGYTTVNEESFKDYLRIVTKQEKDVSLKQAFEDESIHVR